ncbi:MAG: sodium:calcium antiporter [Candidatus Bathyarchaeota archaeon]|nr:sodium:calcium antiporter [Candidatus Bathyarchaeota archaeon]
MIFEAIVAILVPILVLIVGLALLVFSSDTAVEHSVSIASALGASPLIIGVILVSLGTDLPEIANSVIASKAGHGDINVGDSLGSILAQITLVLGLLPFLVGTFKVKRKEVLIIGACEVLALIIAVSMAEKGYITRMNALLLVASWGIFMLIVRNVTKKKATEKEHIAPHRGYFYHFRQAVLGFMGVAIGAYVVIQSVIALSAVFHISEYLISFFVVAIGTSLPELVVDLTAIRKSQHKLAIGNTIGSCIFDACFSIGIGPLIFPIVVSGRLATITGSYTMLVSIVVISTLALREKVDRISGALFIFLYSLSYLTLRA